jgi:hypothetical protein
MTLSWDKELMLWDYDPNDLLDDGRLNPDFVEKAHRALKAAVGLGLRPKVHQAYRSPKESDDLHKKHKAGKGGRAAPAWQSVHNYGLAMDVWLYDHKNRYIDNHVKGWYKQYKLLAKAASALLWGEPFDDSDHFEYHPGWKKPAKGKHLLHVRDWAIRAAAANRKLAKQYELPEHSDKAKLQYESIAESDSGWLSYFWWAAGAKDGEQPPAEYLAANKPPVQA